MAPLAGFGACAVCGPSDALPETVEAHCCLGVCFGTARSEGEASLTYRGLLLGVAHSGLGEDDLVRMFRDERCNLSGASVELFAQTSVGTLKGVAVSGLLSDWAEIRGVAVSGLGNRSRSQAGVLAAIGLNRVEGDVRGVQAGLCNAGMAVRGVQLGLLNFATELKGVQLGLLNFSDASAAGVLPLVRVAW